MINDPKFKIMDSTPLKILAIDDDEFIRIFMKDVFWLHKRADETFSVVSSIKKAKEFLKSPESKANLIFLDLRLPFANGEAPDMENSFKFLKELKSGADTKDIKVIIFSSFGDKEIQERVLKLGANKFMVKGEYLPQEIIEEARLILAGEEPLGRT